ncbi:hypothetical protein ACFS2C_27875 [Prauserella oleivorans]|uniref:Maltokinase N-terminal cap domain-containing protein n=1 Tax=Prauserella oleivorans TaxID=1478153 RepID=A0ABW5WLG5_9PSEU
MAKIHRGATLTPPFEEFLPAWVLRRPWYRGGDDAALTPVGWFRLEDPAGEVGIETHLLTDGTCVYQVPLTYRSAPIEAPLVATAEHSVLGTRWIHDAEADPVWRRQLVRLVRTGGVSDSAGRHLDATAIGRRAGGSAHGRRPPLDDSVSIELRRVVEPGPAPDGPGVAGVVHGRWPGGSGCLAVLYAAGSVPASRSR